MPPQSPARSSEEEAKKAWLAKLDAPKWGKAAVALTGIASEAVQLAEMAVACHEGDEVACNNLSREEEAKRAWLTKLDAPTWGAAAAAVSAVAEVTQSRAPGAERQRRVHGGARSRSVACRVGRAR